MCLYIHDIAISHDVTKLHDTHILTHVAASHDTCDLNVTSLFRQPYVISVSWAYFALLSIIFYIRSTRATYDTYVLTHVAASYETRVSTIPHTSDVITVPIAYILIMLIHKTWLSLYNTRFLSIPHTCDAICMAFYITVQVLTHATSLFYHSYMASGSYEYSRTTLYYIWFSLCYISHTILLPQAYVTHTFASKLLHSI